MSGFEFSSSNFLKNIGDVTASIVGVASSVADAKFGWAERDLNLKLKQSQLLSANNQIKIKNLVSDTELQIAKIQAANTLKSAQNPILGIDSFNTDSITQAIANLNTKINGKAKNDGNVMLWLTIAGVGFAALQYFKGK